MNIPSGPCRAVHAAAVMAIVVAVFFLGNDAAAQKTGATRVRDAVLIDAAHGGGDPGATLAPGSLEKTLTLSLASALSQQLTAASVPVRMTRNDDSGLTAQRRVAAAQAAGAVACISLHASASGVGVHIFTVLPPAPDLSGPPLLPWSNVQSAMLPDSRALARKLEKSLTAVGLPTIYQAAAVSPLEAMPCPAVAIEVSPRSGGASLSDAAYQQQIVKAVSETLVQWREAQAHR